MKPIAHARNNKALALSSSFLKETAASREGCEAPLRHSRSSDLQTREILSEGMFRRVLRWERKRAERYQKSFMLMLLDASQPLLTDRGQRTLPAILAALSRSTRETDMAGWYQEEAILGVLFTEVCEADRRSLEKLLRASVTESLRAKLGAEMADWIRISFHFFPEGWNEPNRDHGADVTLYPDLLIQNDTKKFPRILKRAMDITGSILALLLFSPVFAIISTIIKLTSKGPIFYRQERVGQYGRGFTFLKFRSMTCANDPGIHRDYVRRFIAGEIGSKATGSDKNPVFKITADPRVTRVGKFLRKTSLDELPQFINVLKGEMSLVGPRPPIPYELESYRTWHRRRVLDVKPGITGLWQVKGRSRTSFDDMVRLDLRYAGTWSPWLDIKILLQTPRAAFFGEGAY